MLNNQTNQWNGTPMPLIMGFITPQRIQELENETPIMYDPLSQVVFDMRVVGTKCLRTKMTDKGNQGKWPDQKNEIDDQKNVS
ncbi:MAG: hypothetical protein LBD23_07815 [Oscillospiraceae bacterium]|jgi:hypothetical protein|nr:hypothetical protein [Oscillospiraceae bacterium]